MSKDSQQTIWSSYKDFLGEVSVGGIRFVVADNSSIFRKGVWFLLVLCGCALMGYQIYLSVDKYFDYPTSTKVSINYNTTGGRQFPAVTFCSESRAYMDSLAKLGADGQTLKEKLYPIAGIPPFPEPDGFDITALPAPMNSMRSFIDRVGFNISRDLVQCVFSFQMCDASWFKEIYLESGKCWTFNHDGKLRSLERGPTFGLRVILDNHVENYGANPSAAVGYFASLHEPGAMPIMEASSFAVTAGAFGRMITRIKEVNITGPPHGVCGTKTLPYWHKYSVEACMINCVQTEMIKPKCGCVRYYFDPGTKVVLNHDLRSISTGALTAASGERECGPADEVNCIQPVFMAMMTSGDDATSEMMKTCQCPPPCSSISYDTTISYSKLSDYSATVISMIMGVDVDYLKTNIAVFDISFADLFVEQVTETESYNWFSLFSDIGGAMGLILGSTFLTVCEFIDFFIVYGYTSAKKTGKRQFRVDPYDNRRAPPYPNHPPPRYVPSTNDRRATINAAKNFSRH